MPLPKFEANAGLCPSLHSTLVATCLCETLDAPGLCQTLASSCCRGQRTAVPLPRVRFITYQGQRAVLLPEVMLQGDLRRYPEPRLQGTRLAATRGWQPRGGTGPWAWPRSAISPSLQSHARPKPGVRWGEGAPRASAPRRLTLVTNTSTRCALRWILTACKL